MGKAVFGRLIVGFSSTGTRQGLPNDLIFSLEGGREGTSIGRNTFGHELKKYLPWAGEKRVQFSADVMLVRHLTLTRGWGTFFGDRAGAIWKRPLRRCEHPNQRLPDQRIFRFANLKLSGKYART